MKLTNYVVSIDTRYIPTLIWTKFEDFEKLEATDLARVSSGMTIRRCHYEKNLAITNLNLARFEVDLKSNVANIRLHT